MSLDVVALSYEDVQLDSNVRLVSLPEWTLAGLPVTCAFNGEVTGRIDRVKQEFYSRTKELSVLRPERFACVHFTSYPNLFTYIFSAEIGSREGIADDWLLYMLPARIYAAVRCDGDPYADIHEWLAAQGLEADQRAEAIEVYNFADPSWPAQTDVLVPLKLT
jgi:hypothetical protein